MSVDMPPQTQERITCSISAAVRYEIPANIVLAVAEKEAGKPGQWVKNTNGTYDIGSMQFNTGYMRDLAKYGIQPDHVAAPGCYAYDLAAWRLRIHIKNDKGDIWTKAANYHSRTPKYNAIYRDDLIKKAQKWEIWIKDRFATVNVITGTVSTQQAVKPLTKAPATKMPATITPESYTTYVPRKITIGQ